MWSIVTRVYVSWNGVSVLLCYKCDCGERHVPTCWVCRRELDERKPDGSRPAWSFMGPQPQLCLGDKDSNLVASNLTWEREEEEEMLGLSAPPSILGPFPPWVSTVYDRFSVLCFASSWGLSPSG